MATELRKTGLGVVGDLPWGTHFCHFYATKQDLLDTLVPYFKAGLENNEFCIWVLTESLTEEEARAALQRAVPDLDRYLADRSIEIVANREWYLPGGTFDLHRVVNGWLAKLEQALASGYAGMRVAGSTAWLQKQGWRHFRAYETEIEESIANQRMIALCVFPLAASGAAEILDVVHTHQFAIARRHGDWEIIETSALKQAKAEIERLNEELEQRVVERTRELAAANEELRKEIAERKLAEDELRKQTEILQKIFDHIPVMLRFFGVDGRIQLVNRAWENTLGWTLEEIQQQNLDVFAESYPDPQDRQQVLNFIAVSTGEWVDFKTRVRDGRVIDTSFANIRLADGTTIGIGQDITERKRAEEQIQWQANALAQVNDAIIGIDNQQRITYWNQAAERIYHFKFNEVRGRRLDEVIGYRWIKAEDEQAATKALTTTGSWHGESINLTKRRDAIYVEYTVNVLKDAKGVAIGWLAAIRDITARKLAEEASRQQTEILQTIFDHIPVMIGLLGKDGRIKLVNQAWEETLGWTLDEIQQDDLDKFAETYPDPQVRQEVLNFIATANGKWADFKTKIRDGRVIDTTWVVVHLSDGTIIGIGRNITERKQAEEALQRLARRLKILHEIDRAILAAESPKAILQVTLARLCSEIVPCVRASVVLFDLTRQEAEILFVQTHGETMLGTGTRLPVREAFEDLEDLQQGKVHVIEDITMRSGSSPPLATLQSEGIRSYISVPLISRGQLIGTLNLGSDRVNGFDEEAINTIREVADALALALQHARLLEAEQKARRMAEMLQKATAALAATLDIEQVLDNILDYLTQVIPYESAAILLFEEDRLNIVAGRGSTLFQRLVGNDLPTENPLFEQLRRGEQSFIPTRDQIAAWAQHGLQMEPPGDSDTWLLIPLNVYGATIGFLILGNRQGSIDAEQEIALAQTFAQQAAVAIRNAQMYESVRQQREELRFLAARVTETEEGERRRLARELHDQVGRNLAALNFTISALRAQLPAQPVPMMQRRLDDAQRLVEETGQQIRNLMAELRPAVLDDYGLLAALHWYSGQFSQRTGVLTTVDGKESIDRLDLTLETTLFRITQEALTNVAKHAQATEVTITLEITASTIRLTIADNGVGFAPSGTEQRNQPAGWGLLNMRERAEALGGRLQVRSSPGQGTQVLVEIPR